MKRQFVDNYYKWFNDYVKGFYGEDDLVNQNIELKQEHTLEVAIHAVSIAKALNLTEEEINVSEVIGLFHDIGRFEQFKKYKTFKDHLSENHAALGVKILEENKVFEDLDEDTKKIIIKAIILHNTKELPDNLKEKENLFCKLIRDADKLDIFRIIVEYEKERKNNPNPALENEPSVSGYNKELLNDILNGRKISNTVLKSYGDRKLYELSWILDLNFKFSYEHVIQTKILKTLIDCLPKEEEIMELYAYLKEYINSKC